MSIIAESIIDGVKISELRQIGDKRGSVLHLLRCDDPDFTAFGECYFSEVLPNSTKAWKRHHRQTQNFAVPVGQIKLVIFDARDNSKTKGVLQVIILGRPDAYFRVKIPNGLWYGFSCISEVPALLANCADLPHDPTESEFCDKETSLIPHKW